MRRFKVDENGSGSCPMTDLIASCGGSDFSTKDLVTGKPIKICETIAALIPKTAHRFGTAIPSEPKRNAFVFAHKS
jgi:hypothetical protein